MEQSVRSAQKYYMRRELGLCVKCGGYIENSERYVTCTTCREKARLDQSGRNKTEWRREYMRQYREKERRAIKTLAIKAQQLLPPVPLKSTKVEIPADHKCWNCEWSKFHGDRFFCPLVGCVKEASRTNED